MSIADNKRNVFTTIGSYTSLNQEANKPKLSDLYPSVNNKKDSISFMLDVLKTVAGSEALKELTGKMLTNVVDTAEPKLKTTLKKQFIQPNAGETILTDWVTMPVKNIDTHGKLKVSRDSQAGNLIYEKDPAKRNFDYHAREAIANAGTEINYTQGKMVIKYDSAIDSLMVRPSESMTVGSFFSNYIDNAQILNKKELITNMMNGFYGTMSVNQKKTVEQTYSELQVEKMLEQLLNDDDSFSISQGDYDVLLQKAREIASGKVYYDMGCGLMQATLSFNDLNTLVTNISSSTDPLAVGNALENTINQSTTGTTASTSVAQKNKQTIKDNFFHRIINIFTIKMLEAVTIAPQIRVLFGMMSMYQSGTVQTTQPSEDLQKFKTCIKCISKDVLRIIAEFIFAVVAAYLMILIKPVVKKILKEKINQYTKIIKSLTGVNKLNI